jgi:hypothetical protein
MGICAKVVSLEGKSGSGFEDLVHTFPSLGRAFQVFRSRNLTGNFLPLNDSSTQRSLEWIYSLPLPGSLDILQTF